MTFLKIKTASFLPLILIHLIASSAICSEIQSSSSCRATYSSSKVKFQLEFPRTTDGNYVLSSPNGSIVIKEPDFNNPINILDPYFGYPARLATSKDGQFDSKSVEALKNVGRVLEFFSNEFAYKGLDGKGSPIEVIMYNDHSAQFARPVSILLGRNLQHTNTQSVTSLIDVIAHEMTHGIIYYTSKLSSKNIESAALNEGIADIVGIYAQSKLDINNFNYGFGKGLVSESPIRLLSNPAKTGGVDHYSKLVTDFTARSGHSNSAILSLTFYLLANGGSHPRLGGDPIEGVGIETAAHIFFEAISYHLKEDSTFKDARRATLEVAKKYGPGTIQSLNKAWNQTGVLD